MQQIKENINIWYFALGSSQKTSLCSQYCRENNFVHFKDPKVQQLAKNKTKPAIIQGSLQLFKQIQKAKPNLSIILVGKPANKEQANLCNEYQKIGRLKKSTSTKYEQFKKKLYPNIIFIYGPISKQNKSIAFTLANNIGYVYHELVKDVNQLINQLNKSQNYVIDGLFQDSKQIRILAQYFQIRIAHLKYNRVDLPNSANYFDKEYQLVNFLKDKNYYLKVDGATSQSKILDQIGTKICPKLILAHVNLPQQKAYLEKYVEESNGLILNFQQIQAINKRKGLPLYNDQQSKILFLTSLFYRDLNRKQIILSYYPWALSQVLALENLNRKLHMFLDLTPPAQYKYDKNYSTPIYLMEAQKILHPNKQNSLQNQLQQKSEYWLITGPIGAGKSSVAKYLANEFGFKLIQFQPYLSAIKEKLIAPEDGQQLPLKKVIAHFKQLINNDKNSIYVIDGLPYISKDLQSWVSQVGTPNVISLDVEPHQTIKRSRKKAESDIAAQINQEQSNKAKESAQKNRVWNENLSTFAPSTKIYKVDYNDPQIKVQNNIRKILRPRIFLIQNNSTNLFQNIAIKYQLGFINLNKLRLRQCQDQVKNCKKRDVILCNYGHQKKRFASEDLYWIQKNLGQIRYLGIWQNQQKHYQQQKLHLERPQVAQKPKAAEGQAAQQKPIEDPPAQGNANKNKLDIYDYEWSKPGDYKNLSQWFFKSKSNITEIQFSSAQECFKNFQKVLNKLNQSSDTHVYQKFK